MAASLLLFNAREDVRALWEAAQGNAELSAAVERLRPISGQH